MRPTPRSNPVPPPLRTPRLKQANLSNKIELAALVRTLFQRKDAVGPRRLLWALTAVCSDALAEAEVRGLVQSDMPALLLLAMKREAQEGDAVAPLVETYDEALEWRERATEEARLRHKTLFNRTTLLLLSAAKDAASWYVLGFRHGQKKLYAMKAPEVAEAALASLEACTQAWMTAGYERGPARERVLQLFRGVLSAP